MAQHNRVSRRSFVSGLGAGCAIAPLVASTGAESSADTAALDGKTGTHEPRCEALSEPWTANWIWLQGAGWAVNCYVQARKEFTLSAIPKQAALKLSAYSDYVLYLNGHLLGRGPLSNDPDLPNYDLYEVGKVLTVGRNTIAILAHNYGVGTHLSPRGRGGLIVELNIDSSSMIIATDSTWKVKQANAWVRNSPRTFWSAGFLETFDFRHADSGWIEQGYDDSGWDVPESIGRPPVRPWSYLSPRQIPLLEMKPIEAKRVETGAFSLRPHHAVRFDQVLTPGKSGIVYAAISLIAPQSQDVVLSIECDDAFRMFVNGHECAQQLYSEEFARTRLWRGKDDYDQVHLGMGEIQYEHGNTAIAYGQRGFAQVRLRSGQNELLIAVDHGEHGWGLLLDISDAATRKPLRIPFHGGASGKSKWQIFGPFPSTGLNDSLEHISTRLDQLRSFHSVTYDPFDYLRPTDYATLMAGETRIEARANSSTDVVLEAGQYAIFDLGNIFAGYPRIELIAGSTDSVIDVGYTQILTPDRRVQLAAYGSMRYVDRIISGQGSGAWQTVDRRTARYVHISCRSGHRVRLQSVGFDSVRYPTRIVGSFDSSDPVLNEIWKVSVYTTQLVMQQGYQDCLKREQSTLNTNSFNFASKGAAYTFGDYSLARETLRKAIRLQDRSGWFDSHGSSSPNSDEPTQCLYWAVWLRDYYLLSGDKTFVQEVFDALQDNLRYWTKGINRFGLIEGRNRPAFTRGEAIYIDDTTSAGNYLGNFDGELLGLNILYFAALSSASSLASEIGLHDESALLERRAARVKRSVDDRFWDATSGLYADWRLGDQLAPTHHAVFQIAAVHFGLATDARALRLVEYLARDLGPPTPDKPDYPLRTFGFYYYFLEVLFRHGASPLALEVMRRFYGRWLELGATTFGEFLHLAAFKDKTALDAEYEVHAYGTSALSHFYTNLLGVRPVDAGFKKVSIAPQPGDLRWAAGEMASPSGPIKISWKAIDEVFELDVDLAERIEVHVQKPAGFGQYRMRVRGRTVDS